MSAATLTSPAVSGAASAAPPRQIIPLAPSRLQLAEHAVHSFVVTLRPDERFEDIFDSEFWANAATEKQMRPGDMVAVHDSAGRFFAELYVRASHGSNARSGTKGGATVALMRHLTFEDLPARKMPPAEFETKFMGPGLQWCVVRVSDLVVVADNLPDRDAAIRHATGLMAART
jgi:hypothetical protein